MNGEYLFEDLPPGEFVVGFETPGGFTPTGSGQGSDPGKDSDAGAGGKTGVITLAPGQQDLTVDAGFYRLVKLGDFVWDDLNGDGIQDPGEPGVEGVVVNLYRDGETVPFATTTTC